MTLDPQDLDNIPVGALVTALNGESLGVVREAYPNYLLVDQPEAHDDLNVPVHAIQGMVNGQLRLNVNRTALSEVDHEETVHREQDDADG